VFLNVVTIAAQRGDVSAASRPIDGPPAGEFEVALASLRWRSGSARLRRVALRCLLVDDSEEFLASASHLLETQGLEIVGRASSGREAVRLAEALRPDVALVDVQLGEEDGLEVTRQLSAGPWPIAVVLISTHPLDDVAELIADTPAAGFLPKTALSAVAIADLVG
jgi:two-component system, NarL family, nitrate/nitrite response regulator NarL